MFQALPYGIMAWPFSRYFHEDRTAWMNAKGFTTGELETDLRKPAIAAAALALAAFATIPCMMCTDHCEYRRAGALEEQIKLKKEGKIE